MDILFLLVPLSVVLVFLILAVFAWAMRSGQFDDLEREGVRILDDPPKSFMSPASLTSIDANQVAGTIGNK